MDQGEKASLPQELGKYLSTMLKAVGCAVSEKPIT